jgi:hypothetical protein
MSCADCPPLAQVEGEPTCTDGYVDNYNGGCNWTPERFTDVTCGVICGKAGTYLLDEAQFRDTDFYRITVGPGVYTYRGIADGFALRLFVFDDVCPAVSLGTTVTPSCTQSSALTFNGPGTFYLWAGTEAFTGVPCASSYTLIVNGPNLPPCTDCAECPPGAQLEGEPRCTVDYVDNFNGGCNSTPNVFTDVTCGTICGEAGTFLNGGQNFRDTDWYRITVGPGTFSYTGVGAGFDLALFLLDDTCPAVVLGSSVSPSCTQGPAITFNGPGTFYLFAGANVFSGLACGSHYTLKITGPGVPQCTDCALCRVGSIVEGEQDCFTGYVDNYNGGCNSTPNVFTNVNCSTICGKTGIFPPLRDTDWYRITVGAGVFTYSGVADDFPLQLLVLDDVCPAVILSSTTTPACVPSNNLTFNGPGTFYLFASTLALGVPCGSNYTLTVNGPGIPPCATNEVEDMAGVSPPGQPLAVLRPNPFNPSATIDYSIPHDGMVNLQIYDTSGRAVRTLINRFLDAGTGSVAWNGQDAAGHTLPAGTYLYTLELDDHVLHRGKAVILK